MALTKDQIADSILAELRRDEKELTDAQKRVNELTERVTANRLWLKAYGFSDNGAQPKPRLAVNQPPGESHAAVEAEGTIADVAADVIQHDGRKTMTELYQALLARGKRIHRASLDATIRRNQDRFEMRKRGKRNVISLRTPAVQ